MLSEKQKKYLRRLAHERKPVVLIGDAGLSASVMLEIERALARHELLKVRVRAGDRPARDEMIARIAAERGAELVQRIGHVAAFYRRNPDKPRITLPPADG